MRKSQFLLTFFICFFVLFEVSATSDLEVFIGKGISSECQDSYSDSEDPGYIEQLEAILEHSDSVTRKKLAVQFLGKIGEAYPDSLSRVFHILTSAFQSREEDIKEEAMNTATKLVIKIFSQELAYQLIDQLTDVSLREIKDNNRVMLFIALRNLRNLTERYPKKAVVAFKNFFKGIAEFKIHTPEELESQLESINGEYETALGEINEKYEIEAKKVDEEYETALRKIDEEYETEAKQVDEEYEAALREIDEKYKASNERDPEHIQLMRNKSDEKLEIIRAKETAHSDLVHKRLDERYEITRTRDSAHRDLVYKKIDEIREVRRKRDSAHSEIEDRERAGERKHSMMMEVTSVYKQIVNRLPPSIQEQIALFLKEEVLNSSEYSQAVKDMALEIYGDFALNKLDSLSLP